MPITLPIETAERDLRGLLEELTLGETVTLVGSEGVPQALLVSLRSALAKPVLRETQAEAADREARWDALAQQVSDAWQSEKSAVELLTEMRR